MALLRILCKYLHRLMIVVENELSLSQVNVFIAKLVGCVADVCAESNCLLLK
jgi:hypothetical protein